MDDNLEVDDISSYIWFIIHTRIKLNIMKIKKIVVMAIKGNTDMRTRIKETLEISEPTLYRLLTENEADNDLTKASVLKIIREGLELNDAEILEELDLQGITN